MRTIREENPGLLGTIHHSYRGDLESIANKALAKDKTQRYGSAADLGADLRRYLTDDAILARPPSASYQVRKFAVRHKQLAGALVAVFAALVAGLLATGWEAVRANRERDRALGAEQVAKAVNDFLQNDLLAQAGARAQAATHTHPDPDMKVHTTLDRAAARIAGKFDSQPLVEASKGRTIGLAYSDINPDQ